MAVTSAWRRRAETVARLLAALAIPVVIAFAWRQGLFTKIASSYLGLLASVGLIAFLLLALGEWRKAGIFLSPASVMVGVAVLAFVYYCGLTTALAAAMLVLTALAIFPEEQGGASDGDLIALSAGLAVLAAVVGWALPFPVHSRTGYVVLAALLCLHRRHLIRHRLTKLHRDWKRLQGESPAWLVMAVATAFIAGLGLWLPSMNYDDNAAHLILPYQLLEDGYYHLDVSTQAWAVAPWANNVLNGIAALLAGHEARAAVNFLWLLIGLNGAWRVARALGAESRVALAATAAYASLPLTGYFTTTMQVDAASSAVLMQLVALLVTCGRSLPPAMLVGAIMGLLAGLKATNAVFVLPAVVWLVWLALRQREFGWLARVMVVTILLGGSSYCYAMLITGNPLFPLFNATFQSPYFPPVDLVDARWKQQLSWHALFGMTYDTGLYGEHFPGAFGVALLALLPAAAVEMSHSLKSRWVGAWFLFSGVLIFVQIQYIRYLFPATAVLVVVGVVGLGRLVSERLFALLLTSIVAVDAMLLPTTSWLLRDNPWRTLIVEGRSAGRAIESEKVPERVAIRRLLAESPQACIIVANREAPFGAVAGGRAVVVKDPYDSRMAALYSWANSDATGGRWGQLLTTTGASHVITGPQVDLGLRGALALNGFERTDAQGTALVWARPRLADRRCRGNLEHIRDEANRRFRLGKDN